MSDTRSDKVLMDLLGFGPETPEPMAGAAQRPEATALPSLDRRVDIFLRALHGPDREFTPEERSSARARLLDAMAASMLGGSLVARDQSPRLAMSQGAPAPAFGMLNGFRSFLDVLAQAARRMSDGRLRDLLSPYVSSHVPAIRQLRLAAAPLAVILVLGAAWSAAWLYAARGVESRFAALAGPDGHAIHDLECGSRTVSGFPVHVELRCGAPTATVTARQGTFVVKAAEVVAVASVYRPGALTAGIVGPITVAEEGRATVAIATGNLDLDRTGRIKGTLNVTTTAAGLQQLAAAFGGDQPTMDRVAQLAQARLPAAANDDDNASAPSADAGFEGQPTLEVPVHLAGGSISIGSLAIGQIPPLFGVPKPAPNKD